MQNQGGWPPNQDPYAPVNQPPGGSFGSPGYGYSAPIQPYPQPSYAGTGGASSRAIAALILAVASWVACSCLTGIPALFLARSELQAIERGEASPAGKGMAQAAYWIGLVNAALMGVVILAYGVICLFMVAR